LTDGTGLPSVAGATDQAEPSLVSHLTGGLFSAVVVSVTPVMQLKIRIHGRRLVLQRSAVVLAAIHVLSGLIRRLLVLAGVVSNAAVLEF